MCIDSLPELDDDFIIILIWYILRPDKLYLKRNILYDIKYYECNSGQLFRKWIPRLLVK